MSSYLSRHPFARLLHRVAQSDWTLGVLGILVPIIGIIAVLNQG